jgi:hypothetical protein
VAARWRGRSRRDCSRCGTTTWRCSRAPESMTKWVCGNLPEGWNVRSGGVVLCRSFNTNNEGNETNWRHERWWMKARKSDSQKPIPLTSVGRPPFIESRADLLHSENSLV